MSQDGYSAQDRTTTPTEPGYSGWVGWIVFAAAIMVLLGTLHLFQGFVALFRDEVFIAADNLIINVDYTTWGVVHILGGALLLAAGFGVLAGKVWARTVGVLLALVSALANVAFLGAYPFWSLIMIALDIVVIMALTVHGGELKEA